MEPVVPVLLHYPIILSRVLWPVLLLVRVLYSDNILPFISIHLPITNLQCRYSVENNNIVLRFYTQYKYRSGTSYIRNNIYDHQIADVSRVIFHGNFTAACIVTRALNWPSIFT